MSDQVHVHSHLTTHNMEGSKRMKYDSSFIVGRDHVQEFEDAMDKMYTFKITDAESKREFNYTKLNYTQLMDASEGATLERESALREWCESHGASAKFILQWTRHGVEHKKYVPLSKKGLFKLLNKLIDRFDVEYEEEQYCLG